MVSQSIRIMNPTGLHMRPAGKLCREAMRFKCKVTFEHNGYVANAKSVLSVLGASIKSGDQIMLCCDGEGEEEAMKHLIAFIQDGLEG